MFEEIINEILYYIIWAIEIVGIFIIVFGSFYSLFKFIKGYFLSHKNTKITGNNGPSVKLVLANYLALGLEFMLAAETLRTVTISREWSEIIVLGAIIILMAAMSLLIYWELSYEEKKETLQEKKKSRAEIKPL